MSELRPILFSFVRKKSQQRRYKIWSSPRTNEDGNFFVCFSFWQTDRQTCASTDKHADPLIAVEIAGLLFKMNNYLSASLAQDILWIWSKSKIFQYSSSLNADPPIAVENAGLLIKMNNSLSATLAQVIPWIFVKVKDLSK